MEDTSIYEIIFKNVGIDFALFDPDLKLIKSGNGLNGTNFAEGMHIVDVIPEVAGMVEPIYSLLKNEEEMTILRVNRSHDGQDDFYIDIRLIPLDGNVLVILKNTTADGVMEQNISQKRNEIILYTAELKKTHKILNELSNIDDLTKLPNRQAAQRIFQERIQGASINEQPLSVIFMDLDNFKKINDNFGHKNGDIVLQFVSEILRSHIRMGDVAVRWGGDEFLIMLTDMEQSGAKRIANLLLSIFDEKPVHLPNHEKINVSASIGICHVPPNLVERVSLTDVINTADRAMYNSKHNGGNQATILHAEDSKKL